MALRVVIDNSGYKLGNLGDIAMLQVAVRRLRELLPDASLIVLTAEPELLALYCEGAVPLSASGLTTWRELGYLPGRWRLSPAMASGLERLESPLRRRAPAVIDALARRRAARRGRQRDLDDFLGALDSADLFVVSGGGFFNDSFRKHALATLDLLRRVSRRGVPAVLFGQGIGPVSNMDLRAALAAALPCVDLIGLREGVLGPTLLSEWGVPRAVFAVTGDDAIEPALVAARASLGVGVGINLRMAAYAQVAEEALARVRSAVQGFASVRGIPLVPIPIERPRPGSDVQTLERLLEGWRGEVDGCAAGCVAIENPAEAMERISHCRLVIAGSYHAAVFALAQGIPVLTLTNSDYYDAKFAGLRAQFGAACVMLKLSEPGVEVAIATSAAELWDRADDLRPGLLESARLQVTASRALYSRVPPILRQSVAEVRH